MDIYEKLDFVIGSMPTSGFIEIDDLTKLVNPKIDSRASVLECIKILRDEYKCLNKFPKGTSITLSGRGKSIAADIFNKGFVAKEKKEQEKISRELRNVGNCKRE